MSKDQTAGVHDRRPRASRGSKPELVLEPENARLDDIEAAQTILIRLGIQMDTEVGTRGEATQYRFLTTKFLAEAMPAIAKHGSWTRDRARAVHQGLAELHRVLGIMIGAAALAIVLMGCGRPSQAEQLGQLAERLEVAPITGLQKYDGGRVLHPYYFEQSERERIPQTPVGKAADAACWLGDSFFNDCLLYECDPAGYACPSGSRCFDAALTFDPQGSSQPYGLSGPTLAPSGSWYWPLHMAVCLKVRP